MISVIVINCWLLLLLQSPLASTHNICGIMKSKRTDSHIENSDTMQPGESLFDFLKRKKKFSLETSISRSTRKEAHDRNKENTNANANISEHTNSKDGPYKQRVSPKQKYEQTFRDTLRETVGRGSTGSNYQQTQRNSAAKLNSSMTPKKVTFAQDKERKPAVRSSFIQMISPIKRRPGFSRTPEHNSNPISAARPDRTVQQTPGLTFSKRNLNNSIKTLKHSIQRYSNLTSSFKEKSHSFFIELKSVFKHGMADNLRDKMRSLESISREIVEALGQGTLDTLYDGFNEHIIAYEGNLKASFQMDKDESERRLRQHKDAIIAELQQKLSGVSKELSLTTRKLEKLEHESLKQKQSSDTSHFSSTAMHKQTVESLQQKVASLESELETMAKDLDESKQSQKNLVKEVKNYKYLKEEAERRFIEQNMKVKSNREDFLLNEIAMLKQEFHNDMQQLTELYKAKQKQNLLTIQSYKLQVDGLHSQIASLQSRQVQLTSQSAAAREKVDKYKKQTECLVTDLHRMNEELYQHWLALKDIRVLSNRLGILHKFGKIYEDLAYNDQLFM